MTTLKTKIALLVAAFFLLAGSVFAANDFSGDGSCKALWRMESGALTTDSKGGNTLTDNNTVGTDAVNYQEGSSSADLEASNSEYFSITDANCDSGFPLKSDDTTKKISICFWIRPESSTTYHCVMGKYDSVAGKKAWQITLASSKISFYRGYNNCDSYELSSSSLALTFGQWYHIGITYDDSDGSWRIRIWDDTAGDFIGADKIGNFVEAVSLNSDPFMIGARVDATNFFDGNLDEIVLFNDVLTTAEIDEIRAGTYGAGGWGHKIFGVTPTKVTGATPTKVTGI